MRGDHAVVAGPGLQVEEDHRGGAGVGQVGRLDLEGDQLGGLVAATTRALTTTTTSWTRMPWCWV